jgi:hypothetical protein
MGRIVKGVKICLVWTYLLALIFPSPTVESLDSESVGEGGEEGKP